MLLKPVPKIVNHGFYKQVHFSWKGVWYLFECIHVHNLPVIQRHTCTVKWSEVTMKGLVVKALVEYMDHTIHSSGILLSMNDKRTPEALWGLSVGGKVASLFDEETVQTFPDSANREWKTSSQNSNSWLFHWQFSSFRLWQCYCRIMRKTGFKY